MKVGSNFNYCHEVKRSKVRRCELVRQNFARSFGGFTIVELLVVIVVIGVLASVTAVTYTGVQEKARVAKANEDLSTLVKAIQLARINLNETLMAVTGSGCTNCGT